MLTYADGPRCKGLRFEMINVARERGKTLGVDVLGFEQALTISIHEKGVGGDFPTASITATASLSACARICVLLTL